MNVIARLEFELAYYNFEAPSAGCWLSLPHLVSNWSNFLCTQLYNSSTPTQSLPITGHRNMHFRRLWNGMFDRHRAEIAFMQFTGQSLPVHQFVTVPWDFNPVPYCQPSSPTPMEYALPPSLVWPGRRSMYYNGIVVKNVIQEFWHLSQRGMCLWVLVSERRNIQNLAKCILKLET